jgi:hypothetical protein
MKIKDLEGKLASNKKRRYIYALKVNEDTITKKVFNMKPKENA